MLEIITLYEGVMCDRFFRFTNAMMSANLFVAYGHPVAKTSYNIPPSRQILVARNPPHNGCEPNLMNWALVPSWSQEPNTEYCTINTRAESIADKPAFRLAFRHRRCLTATYVFYEWRVESGGHKQPYFINLIHDEPFAFAGVLKRWEKGDIVLDTCSIIVRETKELMRPIHVRIPGILSTDDYDAWMD